MRRSVSFWAAFRAVAAARLAQDSVLNLYSARHYQTDEALYANFTRQTGIKINRIEGKEDELLERIRNEGANSPADVFITVDAARLAQADALGLFAAGQIEGPGRAHSGPPALRPTGSPSPPAPGSSSTTRPA
jgi:iron(III) transport system substrate-binding protein